MIIMFGTKSARTLAILAAVAVLAAGCSSPQTDKSSRSWALWRHGFSQEIGSNPISRATKIVAEDGELAGYSTNRQGEPYRFKARAQDQFFNFGPVGSNRPSDSKEEFDAYRARARESGGRFVATNSTEALQAMQSLGMNYVRVARDYKHSTGSYLGDGQGVTITSAIAPQHNVGPTGPSRSAGGQ